MTKDQVLKILAENNDFCSGEEMSKRLGVSRASVNLAVKSLKKEGYEILSVTNKGYKLVSAPDVLTPSQIYVYCNRDRDIVCLDSVDSTNDFIKRGISNGISDGSVVLAETQTRGKGRSGKSFESPYGVSVYLSYLMKLDKHIRDLDGLTAKVAVCVAETIEQVTPINVNIKWVNDLLTNNKKICGILTEMNVEGDTGIVNYAIIGIGINVNNEKNFFDGELKDIATSIKAECGKEIMRAQLVGALIDKLDSLNNDLDDNRFFNEYKRRCINIGREVSFTLNGEKVSAKAIDIDPSFGLIVEFNDKTRYTISYGETSVRGIYGYV